MTKFFCDFCKNEITRDNGDPRQILLSEFQRDGLHETSFEICKTDFDKLLFKIKELQNV